MPYDDSLDMYVFNGNVDVPGILGSPLSFGTVTADMIGMFDREVFDLVVSIRNHGSELAAIVAHALKRGLVITTPGETIRVDAGSKIVIIGDVLTEGDDYRELIDSIESRDGRIVKLGFLAEDKKYNARKGQLKGYPLESRLIL